MSIYSPSGFDIIKAFQLVVNRSNAVVDLGMVDLSCAIVVCDVNGVDCPVIYATDAFRFLTGYNNEEIIGRNCRFLQAPDGRVEAGSERRFTDQEAVYQMKKMVDEKKEVQQQLINYCKTGRPFLNAVTLVPIPWDDTEIRYIVGFQASVDVIFGGAMGSRFREVTAQLNSTPPRPMVRGTPIVADFHEPVNNERISLILRHFLHGSDMPSDTENHRFYKMLINNSDDVIQILSLKGVLFYVSPSCKLILGYDPPEMIDKSLSTLCHPSDLVLVMRTLRDAKVNTPMNVLFRMQSKEQGYVWFENCGSLFREKIGARGFVVMVGRKRPVFTLNISDLDANGGLSDHEFWSKISTSGIFLFVSKRSRSILDLPTESLVGMRIQDLVRDQSTTFLENSLEVAKRGNVSMSIHYFSHSTQGGRAVRVQVILYPGDSSPGLRASFLLAQVRIMTLSAQSTSSTAGPSTPTGAKSSCQGSLDDAIPDVDKDLFNDLGRKGNSNWQFMVRELERSNQNLAAELATLLNKEKRKSRARTGDGLPDGCANCHTKTSPEWRRGPSGQRDLCNRCGIRWAKQNKKAITGANINTAWN